MTWEPRPVPNPTAETADYWAGASEERLLLPECQDCGLIFYPPRTYCPDCFGETEYTEAAGTGIIHSYTVTSVVESWPDEHGPLVLAYVELAEGPLMLTSIQNCDPDDVAVGADVTVTFEKTDDPDVGIPVFELSE